MANQATPFFKDGRSFPTRAQLDEAVSDLAELLSLDRYTLAEIAARMEITRGTAAVLFCDLCARYGEAVA
jgi:hypothetical protein